jgi:hypothetical protein
VGVGRSPVEPMPRIEIDIDSPLAPERIRAALIDFSERRPERWPGLNPKEYRVYAVGDTWAEVREGNGGPIWARERYDWSRPGNVTWTVLESGFSKPGSYVSVDLTPRPGGGSHLHLVWNRRPSSFLGWIVMRIIALVRGRPVRSSMQAGLDGLESEARTESARGASRP